MCKNSVIRINISMKKRTENRRNLKINDNLSLI